mgnify:CR=1 FL=1
MGYNSEDEELARIQAETLRRKKELEALQREELRRIRELEQQRGGTVDSSYNPELDSAFLQDPMPRRRTNSDNGSYNSAQYQGQVSQGGYHESQPRQFVQEGYQRQQRQPQPIGSNQNPGPQIPVTTPHRRRMYDPDQAVSEEEYLDSYEYDDDEHDYDDSEDYSGADRKREKRHSPFFPERNKSSKRKFRKDQKFL